MHAFAEEKSGLFLVLTTINLFSLQPRGCCVEAGRCRCGEAVIQCLLLTQSLSHTDTHTNTQNSNLEQQMVRDSWSPEVRSHLALLFRTDLCHTVQYLLLFQCHEHWQTHYKISTPLFCTFIYSHVSGIYYNFFVKTLVLVSWGHCRMYLFIYLCILTIILHWQYITETN